MRKTAGRYPGTDRTAKRSPSGMEAQARRVAAGNNGGTQCGEVAVMAMRLASRPILEKAPPVKAKTYLSWLHSLPCIVSGRSPVEAAHVSFANPAFAAPGRGKSQKVSDRWALPLHPDLHREQHTMNEQEFWRSKGINPHLAGVVLYGLWSERKDDGLASAERLIRSKAFLAAPQDLPGA